MLGPEEFTDWQALQQILRSVEISEEEDEVSWGLSSNKIFTTQSLYKTLTPGGVDCKMAKRIWKCKISLKIRIFLWQVCHNRLQIGQQLKIMEWKGRDACKLCGKKEDVEHLLFSCDMAEFGWAFLSEALGWKGYPKSLWDLQEIWLPRGFGVNYQIGLACFPGIAWGLWNTRNKTCIRKDLPTNPIDVVHLCLSYI
jgi:hypothetical protein